MLNDAVVVSLSFLAFTDLSLLCSSLRFSGVCFVGSAFYSLLCSLLLVLERLVLFLPLLYIVCYYYVLSSPCVCVSLLASLSVSLLTIILVCLWPVCFLSARGSSLLVIVLC